MNGCRRLALLLSVAAVTGCAPAVVQSKGVVAGSHRAELKYYLAAPPGSDRYPVVLILDDGGCVGGARMIESPRVSALVSAGYAVVVFDKPGVGPHDDGKLCSSDFLATNDRFTRVRDGDIMVGRLQLILSRWDGRLVVLGEAEGAVVAAEVAAHYDAASAVALLPGSGWERAHELMLLKRKEFMAQGVGPATIARELFQLDNTINEIELAPVPGKTWLTQYGTYLRWSSYMRYAPVDDLVRLACPIYIAHGTADTVIPIESSEAVVKVFEQIGRKNITFKRYDGLDHQWRAKNGKPHVVEIERDFMDWLEKTVPVQHASASAASK
jgi:alpha-beta hydrolase superfamily lysophospholipase